LPVLGPVDFNADGNTTDAGLQQNLNDDQAFTVLHGADDWSWIHDRLTPSSVTGFAPGAVTPGQAIVISGVNLMLPANVTFAGGASASGDNGNYNVLHLVVTVPAEERADHHHHPRRQGHQQPEPDNHPLS